MPALPASLEVCSSPWFLELERCCVCLETPLEDSPAEEPELRKVRGTCVIFRSRAVDLAVHATQLSRGTSCQFGPLFLVPAIIQFSTFSSSCRAVLG